METSFIRSIDCSHVITSNQITKLTYSLRRCLLVRIVPLLKRHRCHFFPCCFCFCIYVLHWKFMTNIHKCIYQLQVRIWPSSIKTLVSFSSQWWHQIVNWRKDCPGSSLLGDLWIKLIDRVLPGHNYKRFFSKAVFFFINLIINHLFK